MPVRIGQKANRMDVEEAIRVIKRGARDGIKCPCCGRTVRIYRRKIHSEMCVWLFGLARLSREDGGYYTTEDIVEVTRHLSSYGTDGARLRYWGLVKKIDKENRAGAPAGSYSITEDGWMFLRSELLVSKYVEILNDEVLWRSKHKVYVRDCMDERFDYDELWGSVHSVRSASDDSVTYVGL
jgi:hypothetical protein